MSRLRVRLRGKNIQEVQLSSERPYTAGRKEDCDILLGAEKGISREHFRLVYSDNHWNLEVLSKFGDVVLDGESIQAAPLQGTKLFFLGPYEFEYTEGSNELVPVSHSHAQGASESGAMLGEHTDRTFIGTFNTVPYIKVVTEGGDVKELFKLEGGNTWVAGRDSSCDIVIRDQRVSRRQFEVRQQGPQFYLMDLGSVNGTLLNGTPVSSIEPTPVKSGDAISVLDNHLYFELHDPAFQARVEQLKATTLNPLVAVSHDIVPTPGSYPQQTPVAYYPQTPGPVMTPSSGLPPQAPKKFDFEKHRIKIIIGALVFLAAMYQLSESGSEMPKAAPVAGAAKPSEAFNKLTPEQQVLVKQTYMLAKSLYMQAKYELAKAEVAKIYELVPDYEDVKDIERLANEAIEIQRQRDIQEKREKERRETEEKIQAKVKECKAKINSDITAAKLEECISPVLEFNPEHPALMELRREVEAIVTARQMKEAEKAEYRGLVAKLKGLYSRAESTHQANEYLKAIREYQIVASSSLPDPEGLKGQARHKIAEIQKLLKQKTDQYAKESDQYYKDQKLKDAILTLRKSLDVDPHNEETKDKITRYISELKKQMMLLYQEGVLEESYGNVEGSDSKPGAKDKWKKIIDLDIPDGEYYGKSKIKLKKYGAF